MNEGIISTVTGISASEWPLASCPLQRLPLLKMLVLAKVMLSSIGSLHPKIDKLKFKTQTSLPRCEITLKPISLPIECVKAFFGSVSQFNFSLTNTSFFPACPQCWPQEHSPQNFTISIYSQWNLKSNMLECSIIWHSIHSTCVCVCEG